MEKSTNMLGLSLVHNKQAPILISGIPGQLQGCINLHNGSDKKLSLKRMSINAPKLRSLDHEVLREVRVAARLYPNESHKVHFEFPIDPSSPPGIYDATLQIGEKSHKVQIHVREHIELNVMPDTATLFTENKHQFEFEFVVTNIGNVEVSVGDGYVSTLQSGQSLQSLLQKVSKDVCKLENEDNSNISIIKDILCSISRQQAGLLKMRWENASLKPGVTHVIKSTIDLPNDIQPNQHYYTDVEILSEKIHLDIYTHWLEKIA